MPAVRGRNRVRPRSIKLSHMWPSLRVVWELCNCPYRYLWLQLHRKKMETRSQRMRGCFHDYRPSVLGMFLPIGLGDLSAAFWHIFLNSLGGVQELISIGSCLSLIRHWLRPLIQRCTKLSYLPDAYPGYAALWLAMISWDRPLAPDFRCLHAQCTMN